MAMNALITGSGSYVPPKVLTQANAPHRGVVLSGWRGSDLYLR